MSEKDHKEYYAFFDHSNEFSESTLKMISNSIENLKEGKTGSVVDFDKYKKYLRNED
jgi:hypothetical protein